MPLQALLLSLLACREDPPPVYSVGDFEIAFSVPLEEFSTAEDARLTITHAAEPERVIWANPTGEAFLAAAHGEPKVEYGSGSFLITDDQDEACSAQTILAAEEGDEALTLSGELEDCDLPYTLTLSLAGTDRLRMAVELGDEAAAQGINRTRVAMASEEDEAMHGLGEQYSRWDLKHETVPVWVQEQGIGRGLEPLSQVLETQPGDPSGDWWTTYSGVPFLLTNAPRGLYLEDQGYARFDLLEKGRVEVESWSAGLTAGLIYGESPSAVVSRWTDYTGHMRALPSWSQQGAIVRADGGSEAVRAELAALQAAGVPVAGLWIEDWCGERETASGSRLWWNWEPDGERYPDWAALVAELDAAGVATLIYFNPYLVDTSEKSTVSRSLYQEALAAGWLVTKEDGSLYTIEMGGFDAAMVDLTNPDAVAWLQEVQAEQVALGVDGWMADFAEALPVDAVLADGSDPWQTHNAWPRLWAELNAGTAAATGVDLLSFHRSGDARSPASARAFWTGDQTVTWDAYDGIQTVIPALLSSGISGWALQHTDAGGYLSVSLLGITRDAELLERWVELASLTALLRTHETNEPEENAQIDSDEATLAHFARLATLYAALAPIREDAMAEAQSEGLPLLRPLFFGWPEETESWEQDQSYLLGPLLVAPVVEQGATTRFVWLPPGYWTHLWSGDVHGDADQGSWVTVDAPLGEPPIFYPLDDETGLALSASLRDLGILDGG